MKLRLLVLSAFALFSAVVARAENYPSKEAFTRTGAFDARGEINLDNVNGDVEVHTWNKNEILIEGEKSARTDEELELIDLKIELSSSRADVKVRLPKRPGALFTNNIRAAVRFKLTVPATASIKKLSTVNSSVTIEGVQGTVNASSVNGGVHATNLGGNAHLETVNGSINARFAAVVAEQTLSFETVNGKIKVGLPKNTGAELHSSVVNGHVDCDFPLESTQKKHRKNLSGKIGDGRAKINVETVNGSIHIESL
ncbi:MAG: DUF4097 family beta strand repeat-containing protein [Opitutus sp.]